MNDRFLSVKELDSLSIEDREKYYNHLRNYCESLKVNIETKKISKRIISLLAPHLRSYKLEIYGEENIPKDDSAVYICNHSNSHDFFTLQETFNSLGRNVTPFGAKDCLDFLSLQMFRLGDVTLIDRNDKLSSLNGLMTFTQKVVEGEDGIIFGEGTWNLHPVKPMQGIRTGGVQSAAISKKVIIPTLFEYVEIPELVNKETDLYSRCIVEFGKPIVINQDDNIIEKTKLVQYTMEEMRKDLWKKLGIKKDSIDDINKELYLNHTYNKKFNAFGFEYDSEYESHYLAKDKNGNVENEYTLDENGEFVPGVTQKR